VCAGCAAELVGDRTAPDRIFIAADRRRILDVRRTGRFRHETRHSRCGRFSRLDGLKACSRGMGGRKPSLLASYEAERPGPTAGRKCSEASRNLRRMAVTAKRLARAGDFPEWPEENEAARGIRDWLAGVMRPRMVRNGPMLGYSLRQHRR